MKRVVLLASLILGGIVSAQNNEQLARQLERNKNQKYAKYDFYIQGRVSESLLGQNQDPEKEKDLRKALLEERENLAFFFDGHPYYYSQQDIEQVKNNNVDAIHDGQIVGLIDAHQGEGIEVSVFDGGRIYEAHKDFGGATGNRISNKESSSVAYNSHATGVAGVIGGQGYDLSHPTTREFLGNSKGMMPRSKMVGYYFRDTILEGENTTKTVTEKLLGSLAYLSNHSYGANSGWEWSDSTTSNAGEGWYWRGYYNSNTQAIYDLNGAYHESDMEYDDIVYNNPSMITIKAAGNSYGDFPETGEKAYYRSNATGNVNGYMEFTSNDILPTANCSNGYDCIGSGSLAKNIILVGATDKITNNNGKYTQVSDVVKASYSSAGPRDDGAIKPDITAVGTRVWMAYTTATGSDNRWNRQNGTSFASPQVTGIMGLWLEIYKKLNNDQMFNAASAKTLLIHTAMEAGNVGPDVHFGWGFADAKAGAELIVAKSNNQVIFEEKTLANKANESILLESDGSQPLKVSISWLDPSYKNLQNTYQLLHNDRTSRLVNDFDLKITNIETNQVFYPWRLDINNPMAPAQKGDNLVDNVEQVLIETPQAGIYKVEITHKNDLLDNAGNVANSQNYSLIATGYKRIVDPNELNRPILNSSDVMVFPTLISDAEREVNIHYTQTIESVGVFDMAGRLLHIEKVNGLTHKIDFGKFVQGIYVIDIKLANTKETITRKVIKR